MARDRSRNPIATAAEALGVKQTAADLEERREATRRQRKWRRVRRIIYAVLALVLAIVLAWLVWFSDVLVAKQVKVTGNATVSQLRVQRVAQVPMGKQLMRLDLQAIRARVETMPAVRSANVSRSWPQSVSIEVVERQPVAVINRGSGLQAMDEQGVLFRRYPERPKDLPLVRTEPDTKTEALVEAGKVIGALPPDIAKRVDFVEVKTIDQISLRLRNGRVVVWGSAAQSADKADVLAVLIKKDVREIDVSVPGRPTTR